MKRASGPIVPDCGGDGTGCCLLRIEESLPRFPGSTHPATRQSLPVVALWRTGVGAKDFTHSHERRDECCGVHGLDEVIVEARQCGLGTSFEVAQCGRGDQNERTTSGLLAQSPCQLQSIHLRHHQIEQADLRLELDGGCEGSATIPTV